MNQDEKGIDWESAASNFIGQKELRFNGEASSLFICIDLNC